MGRRVKKTVYAYGSGGWQVQKEILFVYDGWNLIQEKEVSGTGDPLFDKFYVWGLDLSQSIQGAGGIGGLVCRVSGGEVRHYFYDANGNVGQLVDPADGAVTARYEYDPFGNAYAADGADAEGNAFRFSTKYWDRETEMSYYGLRYCLPELGRWINRDPAFEKGGLNLYELISNNPINRWDNIGLYTFEEVIELEFRDINPFNPPTVEPGKEFKMYNSIMGYIIEWNKNFNSYEGQLSPQEVFNIWYKWEKARGSWWQSLENRKCPKKLCKDKDKLSVPDPAFDETLWEPAKSIIKPAVERFHPGAIYEMRSKANADGYSNQCTYNGNLEIIITPPEMGTVDSHAPRRWWALSDRSEHWDNDVAPVILAAMLDGVWSEALFGEPFIVGTFAGFIKESAAGRITGKGSINMSKYFEVRPTYADKE